MTEEERNEMVVATLPLIMSTAKKFAAKHGIKDLGDVMGEAEILAVMASRRFDPARGVPFFAYLNGSLYNHLTTVYRRRKPFPILCPLYFEIPERRREVEPDLRILDWIPDDRDRVIIKKRLEGRTFKEIGKMVRMTDAGVIMRLKKIAKRLKEGK